MGQKIDIWGFSYNILGGLASRWTKYFRDLGDNLLKARIKVSLEAYLSFLLLVTFVSIISSFIISFIYLYYILHFILLYAIILSIAITTVATVAATALVYLYPSIKAGSFARRIDDDLPYAIAQMNVMATAGATPEEIFRSIAATPKDAVGEFFKDVVRDIDLLGYDLVTAIRRARDRAPSKTLESFLAEMEAIITSGGDIPDFLSSYGRELLGTKAIQAKEFSETLSTLAEVFLILMVVFPLLLIVMLSIMSLVGGSIFGMDIKMLMWAITYIMIPVMGIIFLVFLDQIMPRGE